MSDSVKRTHRPWPFLTIRISRCALIESSKRLEKIVQSGLDDKKLNLEDERLTTNSVATDVWINRLVKGSIELAIRGKPYYFQEWNETPRPGEHSPVGSIPPTLLICNLKSLGPTSVVRRQILAPCGFVLECNISTLA
ncbi:hypothetical protein A0H81_13157 [Grifola frondosa]|uniref:Uncharacterized protein n=1 Tax=Grifola frondosa TaxID=5627 RepID=A0A1C7LQ50_GRIFR|nr:hypothetical protein A0H81_13157 [Grifola frondosa]